MVSRHLGTYSFSLVRTSEFLWISTSFASVDSRSIAALEHELNYLLPLLHPDVPDPCSGVTCGPGALCRPTPDGRSYECECPISCPNYGDHEGSRPLCASDARDYPGDCEMRSAACEANSNITFKYYGKCGKWSYIREICSDGIANRYNS